MDLHVENSDDSNDLLHSLCTSPDHRQLIESQDLLRDDTRNQQSLKIHAVQTRASCRLAARVVPLSDIILASESATPIKLSSNSPQEPTHAVALNNIATPNTDVTEWSDHQRHQPTLRRH
jgi:hypothetical protein